MQPKKEGKQKSRRSRKFFKSARDPFFLARKNIRLTTAVITSILILSTTFSTLMLNLFFSAPRKVNAAQYGVIYSTTDHFTNGINGNPAPSATGIDRSGDELKLSIVDQVWSQTDWSGGGGQLQWSDESRYYADDQARGIGGSIQLETVDVTHTENFDSLENVDTSATTASWDLQDQKADLKPSMPSGLPYLAMGNLRVVKFAPDNENVVYAAGNTGLIFKSTDGGSTFTLIASPTTAHIQDMDVIDQNTIWVVSQGTDIYKSTDGGTTWSSQSALASTLFGIDALDATTAYVVGTSGKILKTTNGGSTWVSATGDLNVSTTFYDVSVVDASTVWISGASGAVYKTLNGGTSWSSQGIGSQENYEIEMLDALNGWMMSATKVYSTTDGGASWSVSTSVVSGISMDVVDATTIWVASESTSASWYRTTNGGNSWTTLSPTNANNLGYLSISASSASRVLAVGEAGKSSLTTDGGGTFAEVFPSTYSSPRSVVAFDGSTVGIGHSYNQYGRSTDAGQSWTVTQPMGANNNITVLEEINSTSAWAGGQNDDIWKTIDGGSSWTQVKSGLGNNPQDFYVADDSTSYLVGDGGSIWKTIDGGSSWTQITDPTGGRNLYGVDGISDQIVWIVGNGGSIWKTIDGGSSWTDQSANTDPVFDIVAVTGDILYAVQYGGVVLKSINGGTSWTGVDIGSQSLNKIFAFSQDILVIASDQGEFFFTSNGGTTWTDAETFLRGDFTDMTFVDDLNGFVLDTNSSTLFQYATTYNTSANVIQSLQINSGAFTIRSATLVATDSVPAETSIVYELSADGGVNWEVVTNGLEHEFTNPGSDLRWRAQLLGTSTSTPQITQVQLTYPDSYVRSGMIDSSVFDTQGNLTFGNITWNETTNGKTIAMKVRGCNQNDCSDGLSWSSVPTVASGSDLSDLTSVDDGDRYLQYQVSLSTDDILVTPLLHDLALNYRQYPVSSGATFVYDIHEPTDGLASWNTLTATKALDDSGLVDFRSKTSLTQVGLDSATWSDYQTFASGTSSQLVFASEQNPDNPWIRIEIRFNSSDGSKTPLVRDTSVVYTINAAPSLSIVNSSQESSGEVNVDYTIGDADNSQNDIYFGYNIYNEDLSEEMSLDTGLSKTATTVSVNSTTGAPTSGTLLIDNEAMSYTGVTATSFTGISRGRLGTLSSAHSEDAIVFVRASQISGDSGAGLEVDETPVAGTITWNARTEVGQVFYDNTARVKVLAVDNELSYSSTGGASLPFTLDTKDPTSPSIMIDGGSSKIANTDVSLSLNVSDDSTRSMVLSNQSNLASDGNNSDAGQRVSFSTSKSWRLSSGDGIKNVYVKYLDPVGNATAIISDSIELDQTPPPAAGNLQINDITNLQSENYQLAITWAVSTAADFSRYEIYRTTDGATFSMVDTILSNATNYYIDRGLDDATAYSYKIKTVDDVENASSFSATVSDTPDSLTGDTTAPVISNVSVSNVTESTAIVTWGTDESADANVDYSIDTALDSAQGVPSMTTSHSVTLVGLTQGTTYNFRVRSTDLAGNEAMSTTSSFSTTAADVTAPSISNISVTPTSITAVVTFETDESSDGFVEYGLDSTYGNGVHGEFTDGTSHAISLPGDLESGTTYHYRVHASDEVGNKTTTNDYYFETLALDEDPSDVTAPSISSVNERMITNSSVVIEWNTDEPADSFIEISTDEDGPYTYAEGTFAFITSHSLALGDLGSDATYFYRIRTTDASGNEQVSDGGNFSTLASADDGGAPVISGLEIVGKTDSSAIVVWVTDVPSDSVVEYGPTTDYGQRATGDAFTTSHGLAMTNLSADTEYHYRIISKNSASRQAISSDQTFRTDTADGESEDDGSGDGLFGIITPQATVSAITENSATISWLTNAPADSRVSYGETATYASEATRDESVIAHVMTLSQLRSDTKYYFQISSTNENGETIKGGDASFVTEAGPKIIENQINVSDIRDQSAVVVWTTDDSTIGSIEYGESADYGNAETEEDSTSSHQLTLSGLRPETAYHFRVHNRSLAGTTTSSDDQAFTTTASPAIQNVLVNGITLMTADLQWETSVPTTTEIEFGTTPDYGTVIEDEDGLRASSHGIQLDNLSQGTTYYYRLRGTDENEAESVSDQYQFTTLALPIISGVRVEDIITSSAVVRWTTSLPTTSAVRFWSSDPKDVSVIGQDDLKTEHAVKLEPLTDATTYVFVVKVTDQYGNVAQSGQGAFLTFTDSEPPVVDKVKVTTNLSSKDDTQAIAVVSWETNEPATSQLFYSSKVSDDEEFELSTQQETDFVKTHTVILTGLPAGAVYRFYVASIDQKGNVGKSASHRMLLPSKKANILNLIIQTLEKRFAWVKKLGF